MIGLEVEMGDVCPEGFTSDFSFSSNDFADTNTIRATAGRRQNLLTSLSVDEPLNHISQTGDSSASLTALGTQIIAGARDAVRYPLSRNQSPNTLQPDASQVMLIGNQLSGLLFPKKGNGSD